MMYQSTPSPSIQSQIGGSGIAGQIHAANSIRQPEAAYYQSTQAYGRTYPSELVKASPTRANPPHFDAGLPEYQPQPYISSPKGYNTSYQSFNSPHSVHSTANVHFEYYDPSNPQNPS